MLCLYLAFMAYYARGMFFNGEYLRYFGTLAVTLVIIIALHFSLKKKEKMRQKKEDELNYGTYADEEKKKNSEDNSSSDNKTEA